MVESFAPPEAANVHADVPPRMPVRTVRLPLSEGLRHTQSHDGFQPRVTRPPIRDAWERRTLELQAREISRYRCSSYTGYSRGPEVWKALAKLQSRSHS